MFRRQATVRPLEYRNCRKSQESAQQRRLENDYHPVHGVGGGLIDRRLPRSQIQALHGARMTSGESGCRRVNVPSPPTREIIYSRDRARATASHDARTRPLAEGGSRGRAPGGRGSRGRGSRGRGSRDAGRGTHPWRGRVARARVAGRGVWDWTFKNAKK